MRTLPKEMKQARKVPTEVLVKDLVPRMFFYRSTKERTSIYLTSVHVLPASNHNDEGDILLCVSRNDKCGQLVMNPNSTVYCYELEWEAIVDENAEDMFDPPIYRNVDTMQCLTSRELSQL